MVVTIKKRRLPYEPLEVVRCSRKRKFMSMRDVEKRIAELAKDFDLADPPTGLRPYACPICGKWHMTSRPPGGIKRD